MNKIILTVLLISTSIILSGQTILDSVYISKAQALTDIQQLEDKLEKNFKPYDLVNFQEEYAARLNHVRTSLSDKITLKDFKKEIVHIMDSFREGHIKINNTDPTKNKSNRKAERKKERKNPTKKVLPFDVSLQGEVLRVHYDYQKDSLQLNTIDSIIHLGDRPITELNQELSRHVIVDIDNDSLKYRYLATQLPKVVRSLLTPHHQDSVLVSYIDEGNQKSTYVQYVFRLKDKRNFQRLRIIDSLSTAVLTIDKFRWLHYGGSSDKKSVNLNKVGLDSILKYNPNNLIVDLRQNRGGSARLSRKWMSSFLEQGSLLYKVNRHAFVIIPFIYGKSFKTSNKIKKRFKAKNKKGLRYKGNLYVLIDEGVFSAAMLFTQAMKNHGRATIVGQPTGQKAYGTHAGFYQSYKLKESGVIVNIPQLYFQTGEIDINEIKVEGVQPDIFLPYDFDANNTESYDATIEYILGLIADRKQ